jgi:cysteine synthase
MPGLARMLGGPIDLEIYLKNESLQPACSLKSRVAYAMVRQSLLLKKPIVESSSGNLALGLGYWCDQLGAPQPLCLVDDCCEQSMTDAMSDAGCLIRMLELTAEEHDRQTGVLKRIGLARTYAERGYYWPDQYDCGNWVQVHETTTGPEIWNDGIDYSLVVAAVGTGATISGIALSRPASRKSLIVAVEPMGSSIFGTQPGPYRVAGAGNPFTPKNYLGHLIDVELVVSDRDAFCAAGIMRAAGIKIGSSGATAVLGAVRAATQLRPGRRLALVVVADDGWYENF